MFSENNGAKRLLFGVSLYELFSNEPQHPEFEIPMFLASIILYLDSHGHVPGIFKNKVDNSEIEDLMRRLENGEKIETNNPHAVAGLLLAFLIYLPEPVLLKYYPQYIDAAKKNDIIGLQQLVLRLPLPHYLLLRALLLLLHHLSADQHIKDVATTDLAQVVAPLLLMGPVSSMETDMEDIICLGELFIEEYDIILAPLEEEDYATLTDSQTQKSKKTMPTLTNESSPAIQSPTFSSLSSPSPLSSPTQSSLAPFQRSKYSVNYLEIKYSSLSPQSSHVSSLNSPSSSIPAKNTFQSSPLTSPFSFPLSPSTYSPLASPIKFLPTRMKEKEKQTISPQTNEYRTHLSTTSPLLSRSNKRSVAPPQKTEPVLIGIYGSEPGLKYVESNEKLRQLDTRFEEMVEDMQEKRSLFLNQIESIRKRLVLSTPELRWAPPPSSPSLSSSSSLSSLSRPPRTPPRTPPSRTPPPRTPPSLPLSSSLSNPSLPSQTTPQSPSSRSSHHHSSGSNSRSQSPFTLDPLHSPTLLRNTPSPLLYAERVSIDDNESNKESEDGDVEYMLQKTRSASSLSGEERDIESLHNYYYGKMKALYIEVQSLKDNIKSLQTEAANFKVDKLELQELLRMKDERIKRLEDENKPKSLEESNPSYRPLLPPERKAPSPPATRRF